MSSVDQAWLRMDRPTNLMMVVIVIALQSRMQPARLKQILVERFLAFPRFRQRVVREGGQACWEDDPDFDLDNHVRRVALPGARSRPELQELVSDLASTALDPARPMWQLHLVENYRRGSVLVIRIHHCYADGIALIRVLLSMSEPVGRTRQPDARAKSPRVAEGPAALRVLDPLTDTVAGLYRWGGYLWQQYLDILTHPPEALGLVARGIDLANEAARLSLMPADPWTVLKGPLGATKQAAWCERIPLPEVKAIGALFGCSLNDVLLACVAGALRRHLLQRGETLDAAEIRALVPVNLRSPESGEDLGNQFGLVFLALPVGEDDPLARLKLVHARMQELKQSSQPMLAFGILNAIGMAPEPLQQAVLDALGRNASLVMTNVPGPRQPIALAGIRVSELIFWVPQAGDIGLGVSIVSYMDGVQVGVLCDRSRIPQPEILLAAFRTELEHFILFALMLPWDSMDSDGLLASIGAAASASDLRRDGEPSA
jgi:WS/DGAT/MGAT family acyltransferase